jgi:hypothetical protein
MRAAPRNSATVLTGRETEVDLVVPTVPGDYELRYRRTIGDAQIEISQPLQSITPDIEISAPDTAQAGGSLEVTVTGDIGASMLVDIVKSGSEAQAQGPSLGLKAGQEFTGVISRLPKTPGDYEIRCVSNYYNGRTVFARRSLTIQ